MKFKNESGRSMVEMLGVLAIIGVLSIGGIAGYVLSMNRYRANNLIDLGAKFASLAYSANATAETFNKTKPTSTNFLFSEAGLGTIDTASGENITLKTIADKSVTVTVKFSSKDVCETAISILGKEITSETCAGNSYDIEYKQN